MRLAIFSILSALVIISFACSAPTEEQSQAENEGPVQSAAAKSDGSGIPVINRPQEAVPEATLMPVYDLGGAKRITWEDLSKVTFTEKYFEEVGGNLLFPSFSDHIKDFSGQRVYISGYVIPIEPPTPEKPARYVLSANPFSSCFFCGNAGPESVMELLLHDEKQVFYTDDFYTFVGSFSLNDSDINRLNYLMNDAKVYQER